MGKSRGDAMDADPHGGMSMEKKEAVYYWENLRKTFSEYAEKEKNIWAKQHYQFSVEAIDAALNAMKMPENREPLTQANSVQVCPVCHGKGMLPTGFYGGESCGKEAIFHNRFPETCRTCFGKGVVETGKEENGEPMTNDPLTIEQLREMDGKPVWIVEWPKWGHWELSENGEDYLAERDLELYGVTGERPNGYGWLAYAYPPAHIDPEAWEKPCSVCGGKTTLYQQTNTTKLFVCTFGKAATLVTECMACPPYADCCVKDVSANSAFKIKFCPECGRPLTEEARDEMKRLRGRRCEMLD